MMNHNELYLQLNTLAVFRNLLKDPVLRDLLELLRVPGQDADTQPNRKSNTDGSTGAAENEKSLAGQKAGNENPPTGAAVSAYGAFAASVYDAGGNLTEHLRRIVLNDENIAVKTVARGGKLPAVISDTLKHELSLLDLVAQLTPANLADITGYAGFLPAWEVSACNLPAEYEERLATLPEKGYGMLAEYRCFILKEEGLAPVRFPDSQTVDQLFGYERERDLVDRNTQALLSGSGCSNVLLYGDAGTGKSSTIKAIANKYADKGLRLIEVKKNQLYRMPDLIEELSASPLKFIIFIDDLSFSSNDDNFSALKAILEGSVSAAGNNTAIYATSNRRHLVKESMEDRVGNELHVNDTLQETMSLAARFGLTITFQQPTRDEYLHLTNELAKLYQLDIDEKILHLEAEKYALRHNGRSPRAAKNCVELLKSGLQG